MFLPVVHRIIVSFLQSLGFPCDEPWLTQGPQPIAHFAFENVVHAQAARRALHGCLVSDEVDAKLAAAKAVRLKARRGTTALASDAKFDATRAQPGLGEINLDDLTKLDGP